MGSMQSGREDLGSDWPGADAQERVIDEFRKALALGPLHYILLSAAMIAAGAWWSSPFFFPAGPPLWMELTLLIIPAWGVVGFPRFRRVMKDPRFKPLNLDVSARLRCTILILVPTAEIRNRYPWLAGLTVLAAAWLVVGTVLGLVGLARIAQLS